MMWVFFTTDIGLFYVWCGSLLHVLWHRCKNTCAKNYFHRNKHKQDAQGIILQKQQITSTTKNTEETCAKNYFHRNKHKEDARRIISQKKTNNFTKKNTEETCAKNYLSTSKPKKTPAIFFWKPNKTPAKKFVPAGADIHVFRHVFRQKYTQGT